MKISPNVATGIVISVLLVFSAASCSRLDVVGSDSARSFNELLVSVPYLVSEDRVNLGWSVSAPDNSVRFIWSRDFAEPPAGSEGRTSPAASALFDVMLEINAAPFIAAGLDPSSLPGNFIFREGTLITGVKLGTQQLRYNGEVTPLSSYQQIVKVKRSAIGYHGAMDHYGVNLGDGNVFEWAKDLNTNDKDIVFALNPDPFIKAGVNPNRIEGWVFAKVPAEDDKGRMIEVDKILKPFDLPVN